MTYKNTLFIVWVVLSLFVVSFVKAEKPSNQSSPSKGNQENSSRVKTDSKSTLPEPSTPLVETKKRTKWSVGLDSGGGGSVIYYSRGTVGQGAFQFQAFFGYDLLSTCGPKDSCMQLFFTGGLGGGGYIDSKMAFFKIIPGMGIKVFFGDQRIVALRIVAGLGYKYTDIPDILMQDWRRLAQYVRNPDHQHLPLFFLQPGVEVHLGPIIGTPLSQGFSVTASLLIENGPGGRDSTGLSLSVDLAFLVGLRYQF